MPRILESKYPIFSRGHVPMTGKDRVEVDGVNIPVGLDDVLVEPGDIGRATTPAWWSSRPSGPRRPWRWPLKSTRWSRDPGPDQGMSLKEARRQLGYQGLQGRKQGN